MSFFFACIDSGIIRPAVISDRRLLLPSLTLLLLAAVEPPLMAQQYRDRSVIKPIYFTTFRYLNRGQYERAEQGFSQAGRRAIRTANARWIDSICYHTMHGEVLFRQGKLPEALDLFKSALQIYLQNSDWMLRMRFPNTIPPDTSASRPPVWANSRRQIRPGRFPETFSIMRGGRRLVQGQGKSGIANVKQLQSLHVDELVRCTALAIRRYAELLGPLAQHDQLFQQVLERLAQRQGPPNHWSEIWLDFPLGVAYAVAGKKEIAASTLRRSMLAGGELDHPLSGVAMLELGRLHLADGDYDQASNWFQEAATSAAHYQRVEVIEEAFCLTYLAQMASGRGGIPPTLAAAATWAKRNNLEQMYASLLLRTAEGAAIAGELKAAVSTLDLVRRAIGRTDMVKARVGAETNYVATVIAYMQGNTKAAAESLKAAIDFQRFGSLRLFHVRLVDAAYINGTIRERVAMKRFAEVLDDPPDIVWRHEPLEALSQLLVPQPVALNHWFEAALKREQPLAALNIVDRMHRARFFSTQPLGGRLLNLRWIMQGHSAALPQKALLERGEFMGQLPRFAELDRQADKVRAELKKEPLLPEDPTLARKQAKLLKDLAKISSLQEKELMKMAVRREPVAMVFPPLRSAEDVQKQLAAGEAVLMFHVTTQAQHVFLLSHERHRHWKIISPEKVKNHLVALLRSMGHHDQGREVDLAQLADTSWQVAAKQLLNEITAGAKIDLGRDLVELVVVPDGFYWYVPFEALWVGENPERTLLSKTRVRYAPTLGLTIPDGRDRPQSGDYAIVLGRLYPREEESIGQAAFEQIRNVVPRGHAINNSLRVPSNALAVLLDGLIVWDDMEADSQNPLKLAPLQVDRGLPGSTIQQWLTLPWGSPDIVVLPGFHTPAENSLKKISTLNRAGDELFLTSMGLLAAGSRTIVLSRWRTGGQTASDLIREFIQELPNTTAQDSWQRAVQIAQETPINPETEPRVKSSNEDAEITGEHPFFWSGYLVIDPGRATENKQAEEPKLEFPKKQAG